MGVEYRGAARISRRRLERALDPGAMRKLFGRRLPSCRDGGSRVVECALERVRQWDRDDPRCIVEYVLRLEDLATGTERTERATGTIYAGPLRGRVPARRARRKLRAVASARSLGPSPDLEPCFLLPELQMLVQIFPFDYRLPGLATLAAGIPPELGPVLASRFGHGHWRLEGSESELVRHVAETRATFRVTAVARDSATGRVESRRFYAKTYRSAKKARRRYEMLKKVTEEVAATDAGLTVPTPIALLGDLQTVVLEEVPGTSLEALVMGDADVTPPAHSAGLGLAALHLSEINVPPGDPMERRTVELARDAASLARVLPSLRGEIAEVVEGVTTARDGEGDVPLVPAHRDLGLEHMLLDGPCLGLVDLDAFGLDDPLRDVLRVLLPLSVARAEESLSPERARSAQRGFIGAYHTRVPSSWSERLPARYAEALLQRAANVTLDPGHHRTEDAAGLVHQARRSLSGRLPWDD